MSTNTRIDMPSSNKLKGVVVIRADKWRKLSIERYAVSERAIAKLTK
jgi:hypothetical protein